LFFGGERYRQLFIYWTFTNSSSEGGSFTLVGGSSSMRQMRNVFEAILKYGHDEDFAPTADDGFDATSAPAGSKEKLDVLAERVLRGEPLWHPEDRPDYTGLTGAVRPRE
jgi:hypothetical protein